MPSEPSSISKRERAGARRRGREFCLALLYASDAGVGGSAGAYRQADDLLNSLLEEWGFSALEARKLRPAVRDFGLSLVEAYLAHREEIDAHIDRLSQGWTLERMPVVDRNLLRMAMAELLYLADIPVGATIDEAVDLAKEYGTAESGKFVNGILGTVARELAESRKSPPGGTGIPPELPANDQRAAAAAASEFPLPEGD
jgi:N utilization substance protein B